MPDDFFTVQVIGESIRGNGTQYIEAESLGSALRRTGLTNTELTAIIRAGELVPLQRPGQRGIVGFKQGDIDDLIKRLAAFAPAPKKIKRPTISLNKPPQETQP